MRAASSRQPRRFSSGLLHPIKGLLQDLPILEVFDLLNSRGAQAGFLCVLGRFIRLEEDAKVTRERLIRELIRRSFAGDVMVRRDQVEDAAFARIRSVECAFVELDAFAQALDETESLLGSR